ncbi:ejaculatory bulb-specific protein 3 [Halyomorpha halys]|uniref:ejaculatory bulb-specific protein 3 n=1 Tax=Halyomorpha halys TaxID=286706 RepID=UPI0006D502F2|nr:ejaculatory bulb-specific protein 3 [Halyomorpha halys]
MRFTVALFAFVVFAAAAPQSAKIDKYDIEQIFNDEKLFQQYFNCVMGRGQCTPGGQKLKDSIADHVKSGCANCPPERKARAQKMVKFMIAKKASQYEEFEKMYDSEQKLRKLYA